MTTFEANYLTTISDKVNINFSAYYNVLENLVVRTVDVRAAGANSARNVGEMKTIGSELLIKTIPVKNVKADVSITYQKSTDNTK